ncbi:hypothetical protein [Comamonas sp.]|uniref:hypothetical protein n=1 Tax=Comamonas sp. TaxID=34028 RepID=UPI003A8E0B92
MAYLIRFILALSFFAGPAYASFPMGQQWRAQSDPYNAYPQEFHATKDAACAALYAVAERNYPNGWGSPPYAVGTSGGIAVCNLTRYNNTSGSAFSSQMACPANSSASGSSCTCSSGFNEENGQCVAGMSDQAACMKAYSGTDISGIRSVTLQGQYSSGNYCESIPESIKPGVGCSMKFDLDMGWKTDGGQWFSRGTLITNVSSGSMIPCVPGLDEAAGGNKDDKPIELPKKQDPACPNGYQGQVGGETKCIPSYGYNGVDFAPKTTTKENDKTRTETTTKTECAAGKCTTTVTEKVTDKTTGQSTTTSNSTTEVDRDWCAKTENKDQCAANGKPAYSGQGTGVSGNGGGEGDEDDKGGRCGGKNQPKCKIDEEGTPKSDGMLDEAKGAQNQAHQQRMDELGKIQAKGDKDTSMGLEGGFSWLMHKACTPWNLGQMDIEGKSIKLEVNICAIEPYVTAVMNFLWILGTLFMTVSRVFAVMTGSKGD